MFPFVDNVYIISLNRQYYNDNEYWIQLMSQHWTTLITAQPWSQALSRFSFSSPHHQISGLAGQQTVAWQIEPEIL